MILSSIMALDMHKQVVDIQVKRRTQIGFLLFTLVAIIALVKLGFWQLERGKGKQQLQQDVEQRQLRTFHDMAALPASALWYRLEIEGRFLSEQAILLDNKILQGRVGYDVLYPFVTPGGAFLVDLGWIAAPVYRQNRPDLPRLPRQARISGRIAPVSEMLVLEEQGLDAGWPKRIQRVDIERLTDELGITLQPWVLHLDAAHPQALAARWQPIVMTATKHYGYAVQWFLMAVAILGLAAWWFKRTYI